MILTDEPIMAMLAALLGKLLANKRQTPGTAGANYNLSRLLFLVSEKVMHN
jgi:hypothetical protein